LMPVPASAVPAGRPAKANSAPIMTAALSTDFLAFIDPLSLRSIAQAMSDLQPMPGLCSTAAERVETVWRPTVSLFRLTSIRTT
jgi:hypothetical protein